MKKNILFAGFLVALFLFSGFFLSLMSQSAVVLGGDVLNRVPSKITIQIQK